MPKYIPMTEELEKSHPCFICGCEVWGDDEICDSGLCKIEMKFFKEDFEADLLDWSDRIWSRSDRD